MFLVAGALAVGPAGRISDRVGRMPVIRAGFVLGIAGPLVTARGLRDDVRPARLPRARALRRGQSIVLLSRAAAAEMFPPERRARGMSIVLFGVVSGRDLGAARLRPDVQRPAARRPRAWSCPGSPPAAFTAAGLLVSFGVRPDPKELSDRLWLAPTPGANRRRRCARSSAGPGVATAMVAAVGSFAVMVGVMNLAGYVAVGHHHAQGSIFTIISLHIVGMYGLVLVIGDVVERIGRRTRDGDRPARDGGVERRARLAFASSPG